VHLVGFHYKSIYSASVPQIFSLLFIYLTYFGHNVRPLRYGL